MSTNNSDKKTVSPAKKAIPVPVAESIESRFRLITSPRFNKTFTTLRDGSIFNRGLVPVENCLIDPVTGEKTLTLEVADQKELERVYNLCDEYRKFIIPPKNYEKA